MVALGLAYTPDVAPERLPGFARAVEAAGLDELWVWEDSFKQTGTASAAIALASTERIRVGIGLMPAPLRAAPLAAMELATIARTYPGRLVAGLGHGVQEWMGQAGVRVASPLALLEEYTTAIRALLAGESVTLDGRYVRLTDVRLDWPPTLDVPLFVGARGPKTHALAGRIGDGTILENAFTDAEVGEQVALARAAGGPSHPVVATLIATTGPDAAARLAREVARWGTSDPAGTGVGVAGDASAVADRVRGLAAVGATAVAIQPAADEADLDAFAAFVGQVRRMLD